MISVYQDNIEMIKHVATRLKSLREKIVFLGGATTGLLITDKAMPEIRSTLDVDTIVKISSRAEYYELEESLRSLGFTQRMDKNDPICRWIIDEIKVDIMPTDEKILGFSNSWYLAAIANAIEMEIDKSLKIRVVTAPYFLATKIEAFYGRGKNDYFGSHDIEDIITVIDGRKEIIDEIEASSSELRAFLCEEVQKFLNNDTFMEALSGHLLPDEASQARIHIILQRLERIVKIS
jgi:predicted nucleotidyltransferase